uniref:BTB domain-containing protein n=1 Tax=Caenorhabditis tropicalis TaxID=1561998 RepID=A0A1I7T8W0_9PELO
MYFSFFLRNLAIGKKKGHLGVFLNSSPDVPVDNWSAEVNYNLQVITPRKKSRNKFINKTFVDTRLWGVPRYIKWHRLQDKYIYKNQITVEINVEVLKTTGFIKGRKRFFDESNAVFSDVILLVEGIKFFDCRLFLAGQSTYFCNLLMNERFSETQMVREAYENRVFPVIEVNGVGALMFQTFLEDIHGFDVIDDNNVTELLQVARYFDELNSVIRCQNYLINSDVISFRDKLQLAKQFNLIRLREDCLEKISTKEEIKSVILDNPMDMDPFVNAMLLRKYIALD